MSSPSLAVDVIESMHLLAHGEAVRRALRAERIRGTPSTPGTMIREHGGKVLAFAGWIAPLALLALGCVQTDKVPTHWEWMGRWLPNHTLLALILHGVCLWTVLPRGIGVVRVHEALLMPSRRALILAQWIRWLPRALFVSVAFAAYQTWFEGMVYWRGDDVVRTEWTWMGWLPLLFGILATWWQVREPSSPECRLTGRLFRASGGVIVLLPVLAYTWELASEPRARNRLALYAVVPLLLGASWGLMLLWFGLKGLVSAFQSACAGHFRIRVAATDFLVLCLFIASGILFFPVVLAPGQVKGLSWESGFAWSTGTSVILGAWIVWETVRLHGSRELPGLRNTPDAGSERLPEEEEKRSNFPQALFRGRPPRGFAAAWAFRRRVAMAPLVPWMLCGFMAFCLWASFASDGVAWASMIGVLTYPTYLGFGTSNRLHLLGAGLREQHLQNLRVLAVRVGLPAAVLCGLCLALFGFTRERGETLGLVGSALLLRAGVVGFWRVARHFGLRTGLTPVLVTIVFLPVVPPLLGVDAWFEITTVSLALFYGAMGSAGLVLHLASLDERVLLDETRREAERTAAG